MVGDNVAVLDALDIRHASFWGYSMGGWIGFGIAKYAPDRFQTLILGGQHPYGGSREILRQTIQRGIATGPGGVHNRPGGDLGVVSAEYKAQLQTADLEAFLALAQDRPSLEDVLPTMTRPCLLYVGEADATYARVKQCAARIRNVTFVSFPGLSHLEAIIRSDLVLPEVIKFLNTVNR